MEEDFIFWKQNPLGTQNAVHKSHKTPACPTGVFFRWAIAIWRKCGKIKRT